MRLRAITFPMLALAGAGLMLAACGSSSKASSSSATSPATAASGSATTSAGSGASNASVTLSAASVSGLGKVLVNGNGRTLYVLANEKGKVTCVSSTGCTSVWVPAVLPSGMTHGIAGSGVQASLLGTLTSSSGDVRLTYGGWPLYTYTGDSASGQSTGQAVKDTWGTWWVLAPSGNPVTTVASSSSPTTAAPSSGGAGF